MTASQLTTQNIAIHIWTQWDHSLWFDQQQTQN